MSGQHCADPPTITKMSLVVQKPQALVCRHVETTDTSFAIISTSTVVGSRILDSGPEREMEAAKGQRNQHGDVTRFHNTVKKPKRTARDHTHMQRWPRGPATSHLMYIGRTSPHYFCDNERKTPLLFFAFLSP